ncbi:hypothetical protein JZ968_06720 [Riemerella anatipestifer]
MILPLSKYIHFAPPEVQLAYCNGIDREQKEWVQQEVDEAIFYGILFRNKRVYILNIYIFSEVNNYKPKYLDITSIFTELLKEFNIYHLCLILKTILRPFYTDSTLTENIIKYLKHDHKNLLHKRRYVIKKQHNRYQKFIDTPEYPSERVWTEIIYRSIERVENLQAFRDMRNERFNSLFISYTCQPKLSIRKHSNKSSECLQKQSKRKARRRFGAFTP